jgi:serine/threonine protein phosphatase PrpC
MTSYQELINNTNTNTNTITNTESVIDSVSVHEITLEITPEITPEILYLIPEEINSYNDNFTGVTYKMGGSGRGNLENQDAMSTCFITVDNIKYTLNTICDGHDINGKIYADTTVAKLPLMICERFTQVLADPFVIINEIFADFIKQLSDTLLFEDGGTTVTISIFSDGCLIVANIGDCEAILKTNTPINSILVERNGQLIQPEFTNGCIRATTDHNCTNLDEVERVLKTGAKIKYSSKVRQIDAFTQIVENDIIKYIKVPHVQQKGGYVNNMSGDPATYIYDYKNHKIMNLTRSIGDWGACFLSTIPDVTKITWPKGNRARLVVGTDGYFNCLSKENQINELSFVYTPKIICERAYKAVGDTFTHAEGDNMTIYICDIYPF